MLGKRKKSEPPSETVISDHTLVQVVGRYLRELENPAPDHGQRAMYRMWMQEFVDAYRASGGES
jgi:hypothetical protein